MSAKQATTPTKKKGSSAPGTFTAEKREKFLEEYAKGLTVAQAARKVGVSDITVFNHINKNPDFKRRYQAAMETNTDVLEDSLHSIARGGNLTAIFGMLKARRPERWRERMDLTNSDGSIHKALAAAVRKVHQQAGGSST